MTTIDSPVPANIYPGHTARLTTALRDPWWERQPKEPSKSWQSFVMYRDLGPNRSLEAVRKALGVSLMLMERRCSLWRWVSRAEAWDDYLDRQARVVVVDERQEAARRHLQISRAFQGKVIEKLQSLEGVKLSPRDASTWLDIAVKIERQALGESTEKIEVETAAVEPFLLRFLDSVVMPLVKTPEDAEFVKRKMSELSGLTG